MTYRIIHEPKSFEKVCYNGGEYKVQYRYFLFWHTLNETVKNNMQTMLDFEEITIHKTFKTFHEAEEYILSKRNKNIIREYK